MKRTPLDVHEDMPIGMKRYINNYGWHFNKRAYEYATKLMFKRNTKTNREEAIEAYTKLRSMGCTGEHLEDAYRNMSSCQLNSGITYSNNTQKHSLIVISSTSTPAQFMNSLFHEQYHLISHIVEEYNINPFSEEAAYLAGFVGQRMYPKAKHFLCKCHCE